jgi:hypothetical protein
METTKNETVKRTTKCPNLVESLDWIIYLCELGNRPDEPIYSELRQYCKSGIYSKCPLMAKLPRLRSDVNYFIRSDFNMER